MGYPTYKVMLIVLATVSFANMTSIGMAARLDQQILPTSVGSIKLGETNEAGAERVLGAGTVATGYHPDSGRLWHLPGGSLLLDGERWKSGSYVVDRICWSTDTCKTPPCFKRPSYLKIHLFSPRSLVLRTFGPVYAVTTAYSQRLLMWQFPEPNKQTLYIYVGFIKSQVSFFSVELYSNDN